MDYCVPSNMIAVNPLPQKQWNAEIYPTRVLSGFLAPIFQQHQKHKKKQQHHHNKSNPVQTNMDPEKTTTLVCRKESFQIT